MRRLVLLTLLLVLVPATAASADQCAEQRVRVTLASDDPTPYEVSGTLCRRGRRAGTTVQLLLHGLVYDRRYWDAYVDRATAAGHATFAVDRVGYGRSGHPPAADVDIHSGAFVAHQLVQALRERFPKVILAGHSYGSSTALLEASTYGDVDALLITGALHETNPDGFALFETHPAQDDPKFADAGLPAGYRTTQPGTRAPLFLDTGNVAPGVVELDEARKETFTEAELATLPDALAPEVSQRIRVPVLIVGGDKDVLACSATLSCASADALLARERPFYAPEARLEAFVLPRSGHSLNLQRNAGAWFDAALRWADRL